MFIYKFLDCKYKSFLLALAAQKCIKSLFAFYQNFSQKMSNLHLLFLVVSISFLIFSLRVYKKKRIGSLTFLFFFGGALVVGIFALREEWLQMLGITFGLKRGADLFVYISIMALFYLALTLANKVAQNKGKQSDLIRLLSLERAIGKLENPQMAFVIPAYNESDACFEVVKKVLNAGHGVVFIDDGSNNGLFDRLQERFVGVKNLVLIRHLLNLGQGAALQTGFDYLLGEKGIDYVITFDADGQHRLEDLPNFLQAFEKNKNLEIALGSRFLGSTINMPVSKKIALKI